MSLIPYHPREGREIVLRHRNAIVVRDPTSQRLEIRGLQLTDSVRCPTCQRSLRSSSPERRFNDDDDEYHETYVDPDYFRMLRAGASTPHGHTRPDTRPPSSPIRRLVEPVRPNDEGLDSESIHDAEFVSSSPAPQEGSRIRREAFSPNYFGTFFTEERELGRGGKGVVLLVRHEIDGCHLGHFACKRVPVGDDHAWLEKVLVEVELLAKLSHPNLVSYRHVWLEDVQLARFGPSVACAFILQQYCNSGDLLHHVVGDLPKEATKEQLKAQMRRRSKGHLERPAGGFPSQRRLPFDEIYSLFKDITSGLAYLHAANYIHRDLKPSNCLLHREGKTLVCLISDFGEVQPENAVRKSTGSTGTISYCAPEVLKLDTTGRYGSFTAKSDIFSLGMILYFMCFGRLPYQSANTVHEELEDIDLLRAEITDWKGFQDERRERPDLPAKLYQLLKKLLSLNAAERPTAVEVLSAMKSDSSLDGMGRPARSTSPPPGLGGHRIQNLDSPIPPSTPLPGSLSSSGTFHRGHALTSPSAPPTDPSKQHHAHVAPQEENPNPFRDEHSPQPTPQNSLQRRDFGSPRLRSYSMALSRCHDGYRNASHSPERPDLDSLRGSSRSPIPSPGITTPLLMPPTTTTLGYVRHQALLTWYRMVRFAYHNADSIAMSTRLVLFLLKMVSLSWMCWPYSFSPGVGMSLVALAGLDLGLPPAAANARIIRRARVVQAAHEGVVHPLPVRRYWHWDWRASTMLLVLHFVVLWVTYRYAALCAITHPVHDKWSDW